MANVPSVMSLLPHTLLLSLTGYDGSARSLRTNINGFKTLRSTLLPHPPTHVVAGGHGIVRIWDTSSLGHRVGAGDGGGGGGKCFAHFEGHRWGVTSMCFSSDDRLLCTVGGDEHRRTQVNSIWSSHVDL